MNRRQAVVLLTALTVTVGIWTLGVRPFDVVRAPYDPGVSSPYDPDGALPARSPVTIECPGPLRPAKPVFVPAPAVGEVPPNLTPDLCTEHRTRDQRLLALLLGLTWLAAIVAFVRASSSREREHPIRPWTAPAVIVRVWWLAALVLAVPAVLPFSYDVPYTTGPVRIAPDGTPAANAETAYAGTYEVACEAPLFQARKVGNLPGIGNSDHSSTCQTMAVDRLRLVAVAEGAIVLIGLIALTAQADVRDARTRRRAEEPPVEVGAGAPS